MPSTPKIIARKILYEGWTTLTLFDIATADGRTHRRDVFDHGHAAAVLLLDPERHRMLLVRQFRLPVHLSGDDGFLIEVCAGLLDGDDAQTCAQREAMEETGIVPYALEHAFDIYASPGAFTEKVSCFIGLYRETDRVHDGGGLAHEGEEIELIEIGFDEALKMIRAGEIIDAKTVALIQHAALEGLLTP